MSIARLLATWFRPAGIAGGLTVLLAATAAAQPAMRPAAGQRYFVEFRARAAEPLGHTFIVHGRTDARGRVIEYRHVGLVPKVDFSQALILPVPGTVRPEPDDQALPTVAIYRRWLSAADYQRVVWKLRRLQAKQQRWHLVLFNCNDLAIEIADTLNLRRLPSLVPPKVWVDGLRAMNGG